MQDPVCGMTVDPHQAAGTEVYNGVTYAFCSPHCLEKFRADPAQYVTPAHDTHGGAPVAGTVYTCPMHPEVRQEGPGTCPICGMALEPQYRQPGGGSQSRTGRHDPPVLDQSAPDGAPLAAGHVRDAPGPAGAARVLGASPHLGAVGLCDAGRALGWLAVLSARVGLPRQSQSEHVHPHRDRHRHRLCLQRDRDPRARASFRLPSARIAVQWRCTSRPPRSLRPSSCSGKCSNCARAVRRAAPSRPCWAWRRRRRGASARTAARRMCPSTMCSPATACGCARARRSRSMGWCWRDAVPWTNRWSRANRSRSRRCQGITSQVAR